MANTGTGFGLTQFGRQDGGSPTAGQVPYTIRSSYATPIYTGDTVIYSSADPGYVIKGAGTDTQTRVGVFWGCKYFSPVAGRVQWANYFPGSVATSSGTGDVEAYIIDDPDQFYLVRTSTEGAAVTQASVGLNVGLSATSSGNALTGRSLMVAYSSLITPSASAPVRIVDLYSRHAPPGADGTDNTAVGNILVVVPNNWLRKNLTGTTT